MGYQKLQGVRITPKGAKNRFVKQNWGVAQAFGGWIFSADCSIGFSDKPTEINLKIVLESDSNTNLSIPQTFDISKDDLKCSAEEGGSANESLFDIDFNGVKFTDFVLFSYSLDIQPQQKTLSVSFQDYSVLLNKIYIGLIKRQGSEFIKTSYAEGEIPVVCPDCQFSSYTGVGQMFRDISFGSYVGINGKTYDNFQNFSYSQIYDAWEQLYAISGISPSFDLNGGYLILGTEEMYTEVCETIPEVKYSFKQLRESLQMRGINFGGAFTGAFVNNSTYTQSYIGPLREVLNNWCSDFGLQFYADGKNFLALDLKKEIDISKILEIADPKSSMGAAFDGGNIALSSYNESYSLENTYKQSVVTADVRPKQVKTESKTVKNFVRFTPLHPLDFYSPDFTTFDALTDNTRSTYLREVRGQYFANSFNAGGLASAKRLSNFTNRTFKDIDTSIALSKYDKDLRDIYCADKAINSLDFSLGVLTFTKDTFAHFSALGFIPQRIVLDSVAKESILKAYRSSNGQNVSLHPDFYEIYIGYYYESLRSEVSSFESNWASSMYKYGVLNMGTVGDAPFVVRDRNDLLEPAGGLFGSKGASLLRITNSFTPNAQLYPKLIDAPYYNLLPYGTFGFNTNNYYIASLENEWGTTEQEFKQQLYEPLSPICDQIFGDSPSLQEIKRELPHKTQQFNIKDFTPSFHTDLDKDMYANLRTILDNLADEVTDELGVFSISTDGKNTTHRECAKIHIAIIPNIRNHPNVRISFTPNDYYSAFNTKMVDTIKRQQEDNYTQYLKEKPKNICDYSALTQVCDGVLTTLNQNNPTNPSYSCPNVDSPEMTLYAGWPVFYSSSNDPKLPPTTFKPSSAGDLAHGNNARSLDVSIIRNPVTNFGSVGSDGESYYLELANNQIYSLRSYSSSAKIVYPLSNDPTHIGLSYIGVLQTSLDRENRAPATLEIYGSPINSNYNNTSSIKVINNNIDSDVAPILDPNTRRFIKYATVITGSDSKTLHTIKEYHDFISSLNSYQSTYPIKNAQFNVVGSPNLFGSFIPYLSPLSGLTNFNVSISDNGVETNLSFANKPPVLPNQEAILNKIGPRLKPK